MINPLDIIILCQTAPIMKAPTENYAIAEIIPGARYHVEFANRDYYIAVSDETREVFNYDYLGVAVAIRKKSDLYNKDVELHQIFARGNAFIVDNHDIPCVDVYGRSSDAYWMVENEGAVWCQFHDKFRSLEDRDRDKFNAMWQEYLDQKIRLKIEGDGIII